MQIEIPEILQIRAGVLERSFITNLYKHVDVGVGFTKGGGGDKLCTTLCDYYCFKSGEVGNN